MLTFVELQRRCIFVPEMTKDKLTVVVGASTNPERYSNLAIRRLLNSGYAVKAAGLREGEVVGVKIDAAKTMIEGVDTVTLYVGPDHQAWRDYIFKLNPRRIIFNPGTENRNLEEAAASRGIEVLHACTLVLLSTRSY
jgi:uncharacterized protein